jgi:hypothetical protein
VATVYVLKGGTIVDVYPGGHVAPDLFPAPVLVVDGVDGKRYLVGAWRDAEGNGPGHLQINLAPKGFPPG